MFLTQTLTFVSRLHFLVGFVVTLMTYTASNGLDVLCIFQIIRGFFRMMTFILFQFCSIFLCKNYKVFPRGNACLNYEKLCARVQRVPKSVEIKKMCPSFLFLQVILNLIEVKMLKNCLKITSNISIEFKHFPLIFVLLKMTCLPVW